MARNPNLTQDKLDLLAQIPPEVISSGVKTQADLAAMIHGLKSRIIESVLAGEMEHHLSTSHDYGSLDIVLPPAIAVMAIAIYLTQIF